MYAVETTLLVTTYFHDFKFTYILLENYLFQFLIGVLFPFLGEPLFLSPYIEKGEWQHAQFLSFVQPKTWGSMAENVDSYSGYLTVGTEACHSNLFFWYFPAEVIFGI